jgi:short subunit dehydrogenase-like uncharacterized protein
VTTLAPRRSVAAVIAVTLTAGIAVTVMTLVRRRAPQDPATRSARTACAHAERFQDVVEQDGPFADAARELAAAGRHAGDAAARDSRWQLLLGGIQSLQLSLERDDARAAGTGIRVVRAECAR